MKDVLTYSSVLLGGVGRLHTGLELALLGGSDRVDVVEFTHDGVVAVMLVIGSKRDGLWIEMFKVSKKLNDSAILFSEATRTLLYNAICWISQSDILAGFGWMTSG